MFSARILLPFMLRLFTLSLLALPSFAQTDPNAPPAEAAVSSTGAVASPTEATPLPQPALPDYHFQPGELHGFSGSEVVVAFVNAKGVKSAVVDVLSGATVDGKYNTPFERAGVLSTRFQKASIKDRHIWETITTDTLNSEIVIVTNSSSGGLIMTADAKSRSKAGFKTSNDYARALVNNIKEHLAPKLRDAKFDYQLNPAEKQERANLYRLRGDDVAPNDETHAEALYTQATRVQPDYATAYLALAKLQLKQNRLADAENTIRVGLAHNAGLSLMLANNYAEDKDPVTAKLTALVHRLSS